MKTIYFCWKCRTNDHWANEECGSRSPKASVLRSEVGVEVKPEPIKKVEAFLERVVLKKVGRVKVYPDRKTQMRVYMRRRRAAEKNSPK